MPWQFLMQVRRLALAVRLVADPDRGPSRGPSRSRTIRTYPSADGSARMATIAKGAVYGSSSGQGPRQGQAALYREGIIKPSSSSQRYRRRPRTAKTCKHCSARPTARNHPWLSRHKVSFRHFRCCIACLPAPPPVCRGLTVHYSPMPQFLCDTAVCIPKPHNNSERLLTLRSFVLKAGA